MINVTRLFCGASQPADALRSGRGHGAPGTAGFIACFYHRALCMPTESVADDPGCYLTDDEIFAGFEAAA